MTELEFELLLENWVRWSKSRRPQGRVYSLEGNWRSPQEWDRVPTSRGPIDKLAGQQVEDAWTSMPSTPHKLLLKWHYIYLRPVWGICKSWRAHGWTLHPMDYDTEVRRATGLLRHALDMLNNSAHDSRDNSTTALRSLAPLGGMGAAEAITQAA